jgi:hypothetical protein
MTFFPRLNIFSCHSTRNHVGPRRSPTLWYPVSQVVDHTRVNGSRDFQDDLYSFVVGHFQNLRKSSPHYGRHDIEGIHGAGAWCSFREQREHALQMAPKGERSVKQAPAENLEDRDRIHSPTLQQHLLTCGRGQTAQSAEHYFNRVAEISPNIQISSEHF